MPVGLLQVPRLTRSILHVGGSVVEFIETTLTHGRFDSSVVEFIETTVMQNAFGAFRIPNRNYLVFFYILRF